MRKEWKWSGVIGVGMHAVLGHTRCWCELPHRLIGNYPQPITFPLLSALPFFIFSFTSTYFFIILFLFFTYPNYHASSLWRHRCVFFLPWSKSNKIDPYSTCDRLLKVCLNLIYDQSQFIHILYYDSIHFKLYFGIYS